MSILRYIHDMVIKCPISVTKLTLCQDPTEIDHILEGLHAMISANVDVSNNIHFDLKPKTTQREHILAKIRVLRGTDIETVEVLRRNMTIWSLMPRTFWTSSENHLDLSLNTDAQAQLVRSFVCAKGGDA